MSYRFETHFTLSEANALIPSVREVFSHVHALVLAPEPQAGPPPGWPSNGTNGNGHGHPGAKKQSDYAGLSREQKSKAATALLAGLEQKGIVIQDFARGLIDFPSLRDGREVFLCYELADGDRIQYFHDLESGFAGRTPIDEND